MKEPVGASHHVVARAFPLRVSRSLLARVCGGLDVACGVDVGSERGASVELCVLRPFVCAVEAC